MQVNLKSRLSNLVIAIIASSSMAGCMGSERALPLARTYRQIALGELLELPAKLPVNTKAVQSERIWTSSHWTDWPKSTGAREWLTVLTDDEGIVIAKQYQTQGERGDLVGLYYRTFSTSQWKCLADGDDVQTRLNSVRKICEEFERLSIAGKPGSPIPAIEKNGYESDDTELMRGKVEPWELLDAAANDARVLKTNKLLFNKLERNYLHPMTEQVKIPITEHLRIWKIDGSSGRVVTMKVQDRLNISLVGWTISAYAKMAENGWRID